MKFKDDAKIETSDFWYDLFDGGYIKPKVVLEDLGDIISVETAVRVVKEFRDQAENQGVLEEM